MSVDWALGENTLQIEQRKILYKTLRSVPYASSFLVAKVNLISIH